MSGTGLVTVAGYYAVLCFFVHKLILLQLIIYYVYYGLASKFPSFLKFKKEYVKSFFAILVFKEKIAQTHICQYLWVVGLMVACCSP